MNKNRNFSKNANKESELKDSKSSKSTKPSRNVKGKGKTFPNKRVGKDEVRAESKTNDPAWYATNPNLLTSAANLPFNIPAGADFKLVPDTTPNLDDPSAANVASPGVCVATVTPTFGTYAASNEANSPINIAGQALYSFVRHANSGSRNYDMPDLLTYVFAMTEPYSFINWMQRIFGIMSTYTVFNRYYAETLVKAQGIDFQDLLGNMANFNYFINMAISKASAFAVPSDLSIFARRAWLYSGLYADSQNVKDQIYMYNPSGFYFYTFDQSDPTGAAYLKYTALPNSNMKLSDLMAYFNAMITPLIESEDIGIASGDIIKAYGDRIMKLQAFPMQYQILPSVDLAVLEQINNATIVNGTWFNYPDFKQDANRKYIEYRPQVTKTVNSASNERIAKMEFYGMTGDKMLNSRQVPSPEVVAECTRLMVSFTNVTESGTSPNTTFTADVICGTEIITHVTYWGRFYDSSAHKRVTDGKGDWNYIHIGSTSGNTADDLQEKTIKHNFTFRPCNLNVFHSSSGKMVICGIDTDMFNWTLIDQDELSRLHEAVLFNMIAARAIGML